MLRRSIIFCFAAALVGGCADSDRSPTTSKDEPQTAGTCYRRVPLGIAGDLRDLNDQNRLLYGDEERTRLSARTAVAGRIWDAGTITTLLPPARLRDSDEIIHIRALDMNERGDVVGVLVRYDAEGRPTELIGLVWPGGAADPEEIFVEGYEDTPFVPELAKINASGDVIVAVWDPSLRTRSYGMLRRDGVTRVLPFVPTDLNDAGDVVGLAIDAVGTRPVLDRPGGFFYTLSTNWGAPGTRYSIFNRVWVMPNGDVALQWLDDEFRERAFHWHDGTLTAIAPFGRQANVTGVGPNNTIIGNILVIGDDHVLLTGYRYQAGVLDVLSASGGGATPTAINVHGLTVGLAHPVDPEGWPSAAYWDGDTFTLLPFDESVRFGNRPERVNVNGWIAAEHYIDEEARKPVLWVPTQCGGGEPPGNGTPPDGGNGEPPKEPPPEDPGE